MNKHIDIEGPFVSQRASWLKTLAAYAIDLALACAVVGVVAGLVVGIVNGGKP